MTCVVAMPLKGLLSLAARRSAPAFAKLGQGSVIRPFSAGIVTQQPRGFASAAAGKVAQTLQSELKHEEEQYEQPKEIKAFLKDSPFKLVEEDGDVNMAIERNLDGKVVRIEWQLTSPNEPSEEGEEEGQEATDFVVTIESTEGSGLQFFCSTVAGEDHRYIIGNLKSYASAEEKDSMSSYNGPDFEDIDDKLQEALDEYLAEVGMENDLCDFIDAMAVDKEQREYVRWLQISQKFLSSA